MDRVLDADPASGLVRVEAGITLHRLSRELHLRGLALPNLGDIDAQSLAGAIATGTHGTGARLPNLSAQVEAVELVLGDGSVRELTAATATCCARARVGLGALGVVVAVTLRCVPAFRLRGGRPAASRWRTCSPRSTSAPTAPTTSSSGRSRTRRWRSRARTRAPRPTATAPGRAAAWFEDVLMDNHVFDAAQPRGRRRPARDPGAQPRVGARGVARASASTGRSASSPARGSCASRRWSTRSRASPRPRRCAARARSSSATRSRSRSSCGFVAADDALLSPAHGRDSAYVAVHVFEGMPWEAPFREVEALMGSLGGRPHWGKRSFLSAAELAPRYPAWEAFQAARAELDPDGRFANEWARARARPQRNARPSPR